MTFSEIEIQKRAEILGKLIEISDNWRALMQDNAIETLRIYNVDYNYHDLFKNVPKLNQVQRQAIELLRLSPEDPKAKKEDSDRFTEIYAEQGEALRILAIYSLEEEQCD